MPILPPNQPVARFGGQWRAWSNVYVSRGGAWVNPLFVWAFHDGSWRVVWAREPSQAENESATLEGDGTVDIEFDAPDPEAVTRYEVRRSDGTLVESIDADGSSSYLTTDESPLIGVHAYTITSYIETEASDPVTTNTVDVDLSPGTPTVTFVDVSSTRVARVEWGGEQPGTVDLQVFRPNGALAGTVAAGVGTFDDLAPPPNIDGGSYTVRARDALGQNGGESVSAAVSIAVQPSNVNVTGTAPNITITWDAITSEHTGVRVSFAGGDFVDIAEGSTSYNWDPLASPGVSGDIEVAAQINGSLSTFGNGGNVVNPPNVPTSVTAVATGVLGQGRLTWAAPSGSVVTAYEVEWSDNGSSWTASTDDTSPVTVTFGGSSGARYFRVRSVGQGGGVSAWVTASFTPAWDSTPPTLPTVTSLKPEASYGRLVYRFTISDDTTAAYRYRYRVNNGSWSTSGWTTVLYGSDPTPGIVIVIGTFGEGDDVDVQVQVRDSVPNESAWSSSWRYRIKAQVQTLFAQGSGHYRQGVWAYLGNDRVYQGYFSNPAYVYQGFIFYSGYPSLACNADGTVGGDITVTNVAVTLERPNSVGNSVEDVFMGVSSQLTSSGAPAAITDITNMGTITRGTSRVFNLTPAQRAKIVAGTAISLGFYVNSTDYLMLSGISENVLQGAMQITSLG